LCVRATYTQIRQGTYKCIITYEEWFNNALQAYKEQENIAVDDSDITVLFKSFVQIARWR
jgi:hypothetical protein